MRRHVTLFLFILLASGTSYGQFLDSALVQETETYDDETYEESSSNTVDPAELGTTKHYSNEKIAVRKFDNENWKKVVGSTNYDGEEKKKKAKKKGENGGQNVNEGQRSSRNDDDDDEDDDSTSDFNFSAGPWTGLILKIGFYIAILVIIGFILFYIIKNTSLKSNKIKPKSESPESTTVVEDIADLDVDTLLQQAQNTGNYRLAVRIYFLKLLKKLNEGGFITWKKDKTNRDYLSELYSKERYFEEMKRLTLSYEQVWYGDHSIPLELYHELRDEFNAVDQQLNASNTR